MTADTTVLDRVRVAVDQAQSTGAPTPGRPTLVRLTGATDHQIKKALATLAEAGEEESPATASDSPAATEVGTPIVRMDLSDEQGVTERSTPGDALATAGETVARPSPAPASTPPAGGKLVAWAGFIFGSVVSVAANVLAARLAPHDAPVDWQPSMYAQVGAAVWPIAMLLAVEVLSRIRWPKGRLWNLARYGGVGLVAVGSAVISYQHIRDVLTSWGYPVLSAGVGPLVIDGLMIASGFALLATAGGTLAKAGETS